MCLRLSAALVVAVAAAVALGSAPGTSYADDSPAVYVCYSLFQQVPTPLPLAEAAALGEHPYDPAFGLSRLNQAEPYWQPVAVDKTVPFYPGAGLAIGGYYLTCASDLPELYLEDTARAVGGGGETYDAAAASAYRRAGAEALGIYPIFARRTQPPPVDSIVSDSGCLLSRTSCAAPPITLPSGPGWSPITLLWVAENRLRPQPWPQRQQSRRGSGYTFAVYGTRRGASQLLRTLQPGSPLSETRTLVSRFDFAHDALGIVFHAGTAPSFTVTALERNRRQIVARVEADATEASPPTSIVVVAELIRIHRAWLDNRIPRYAEVVPSPRAGSAGG